MNNLPLTGLFQNPLLRTCFVLITSLFQLGHDIVKFLVGSKPLTFLLNQPKDITTLRA
jgi:hypothetical protein